MVPARAQTATPSRVLTVACLIAGACAVAPPSADPVIARATAFLERETERWRPENGCFSCHNNGDAARVLFFGRRLSGGGGAPLAATSAWLRNPPQWSEQEAEDDAPFKDKKLARLQFAVALCALDGLSPRREPGLDAAARALAEDQAPGGAWQDGGVALLGSPITWGPNLATALARRVLLHADAARYGARVDAAAAWLRAAPARNVVEACGVLLGLAEAGDAAGRERRRACLELLAQARRASGGFGPFVHTAPEVFDTALVAVTLAALPPAERDVEMLRGAVAWLRARQDPDGGWLETTRPAGQDSYAHRMSTTAWALQALLAARAGAGGAVVPVF